MLMIGQSSLTCLASSQSASMPFSLLALTRRTELAHVLQRVGEVHHAPLAEQEVVLELGREALPELERVLVDRRGLVPQVVGPDDRGVPRHVAAGQPAPFEHGDVGDAVVLGQVVRGGQTVSTGADDDDVVATAWGRGCARGSPGATAARSAIAGLRRVEVRVEREPVGEGGRPAPAAPRDVVVEVGRRRAVAMMSATSRNSSSPNPRVASAGVPIRRPEETIGGRGSNGTALRFTVMPTGPAGPRPAARRGRSRAGRPARGARRCRR